MKKIIFTFVSLYLISASAGITENQIEIKYDDETINLTPKKGFHLNDQAPASAVIDDLESLNKPATKTEKLFVFKKNKKAKSAKLNFYVCDDKKTVCERHEPVVNFKSGEIKKTEVKTTYNNIKDFNLKSADGRPSLLVFSAPWCPACIRMVTETYEKPEVSKQLKKLNFVKLNSDLPSNNELMSKFQVKAIPSLILLDKNGNETYRWLDFQKPGKFAKEIESELQKVDLAEQITASAKLGDPAAASVMAYKAYNALNYAEAFKWFSLTTSAKDQNYKLASEIYLAQEKSQEDEKLKGEYLAALQKGIVLTSSKLDQLRWTADYFEQKKSEAALSAEVKAKVSALLKDMDSLIKNKKEILRSFDESTIGDYTSFEKAELLRMKTQLADLLEDKKLSEETKKQSAQEISKIKLSVDRPGEILLGIYYLREAGQNDQAESFYKKLINKYPTTYVYYEKYARFLQKNKRFEQALESVNQALKYPEGNQPQLGLLKSQILKDLNKFEDALGSIDAALKSVDIEHKRYTNTVKKLKDLKAELVKDDKRK